MRPDCSGSSRRPRSRSKRRGSRRWRRASSLRRSGFPTPRPRRCSASRPPFRATAKGWTRCSPPAKACRRGLRRSTRWLLVYIRAVRVADVWPAAAVSPCKGSRHDGQEASPRRARGHARRAAFGLLPACGLRRGHACAGRRLWLRLRRACLQLRLRVRRAGLRLWLSVWRLRLAWLRLARRLLPRRRLSPRRLLPRRLPPRLSRRGLAALIGSRGPLDRGDRPTPASSARTRTSWRRTASAASAGCRHASRTRMLTMIESAQSQLRARLTLYPARPVEPRRLRQSSPWVSVLALVLERDLELGAIGLDLAVVDHQILLDDFGDAQVPEAQGGALDRRPGSPLPRFLARADQLNHLINSVGHTFLLRLVIRAGRRKTMRGPDRRPSASMSLLRQAPRGQDAAPDRRRYRQMAGDRHVNGRFHRLAMGGEERLRRANGPNWGQHPARRPEQIRCCACSGVGDQTRRDALRAELQRSRPGELVATSDSGRSDSPLYSGFCLLGYPVQRPPTKFGRIVGCAPRTSRLCNYE